MGSIDLSGTNQPCKADPTGGRQEAWNNPVGRAIYY